MLSKENYKVAFMHSFEFKNKKYITSNVNQ